MRSDAPYFIPKISSPVYTMPSPFIRAAAGPCLRNLEINISAVLLVFWPVGRLSPSDTYNEFGPLDERRPTNQNPCAILAGFFFTMLSTGSTNRTGPPPLSKYAIAGSNFFPQRFETRMACFQDSPGAAGKTASLRSLVIRNRRHIKPSPDFPQSRFFEDGVFMRPETAGGPLPAGIRHRRRKDEDPRPSRQGRQGPLRPPAGGNSFSSAQIPGDARKPGSDLPRPSVAATTSLPPRKIPWRSTAYRAR